MAARHLFAGALTAPLLLLAACGGGDTSVADPPVSPSPPSSSASTPQHESPEAFIHRWADAEKRMENTGETQEYLALSPGCVACRQLARTVSTYYAAGGYVHWGGWRILWIKVNSRKGAFTTYAVRNKSLPTTYKKSAQARIHNFFGGVTTELLQLHQADGLWYLTSKAELAS